MNALATRQDARVTGAVMVEGENLMQMEARPFAKKPEPAS